MEKEFEGLMEEKARGEEMHRRDQGRWEGEKEDLIC